MAFLSSKINKGKAPKEVTEALKDIKDYMAFHQSVSVAMGTALQHLANSLFVNLANLVLLRRDSYVEHVKQALSLTPGICSEMLPYLFTACSPTLFCVLPSRILANMSLLELLQDPVRAPPSAPAGEETLGTGLMKRENPIRIPVTLTKVNNHGINSLEIGT